MGLSESLELLKQQKKKLNNTNNFEEIHNLWELINENYKVCAKQLQDLEDSMTKLNNDDQAVVSEDNEITFSKAMDRIQEISAEIENCDLEKLSSFIKEMQSLKQFCLLKLQQEKINMKEVN